MRAVTVLAAIALVAASCGESGSSESSKPTDRFPDVVDVEVEETAEGVYTFDVTISSPYDSPQRYADAWRVKDEDGTVYGVRELLHDHAGEQPFTRSLSGVEIPSGVELSLIHI